MNIHDKLSPMYTSTVFRFVSSLAMAFCVVSAMLWFALRISGFGDRDETRSLETHRVDLLTDRELGDVLGESRPHSAPPLPQSTPISSVDVDTQLRGMVRLDVTIDAAGAVSDVRVIDASPAGIYEAQAVADVQRRRFTPEIVDGLAVPSRRLEIVNFTVTPAAPAAAEAQ